MAVKTFIFTIIVGIGVVALTPSVHAYSVNGLLDDWGVTPGIWDSSGSTNHSDWTPNPGVSSTVEDQTGGSSAPVGPGWGGQQFDAEAMYFDIEGDYVYIAIVTGYKDGVGGYKAGDIAIDFGNDGTYDYGIITTGANKGKIYKDVTWTDCKYFADGNPSNVNTSLSAPLLDGDGNPVVTELEYVKGPRAHSTNDWWHYVIETRIDLDYWLAYPPEHGFTIHWTMSCGNDVLNLVVTPEPSSLVLLLAGIFGFFGSGFAKRKKI